MTRGRHGGDAETDLDALLCKVNEATSFDPPGAPNRLTGASNEPNWHGIPPQPDPDRHPGSCAFWTRMSSQPLSFERTEFSFQAAGGIRLNPRRSYYGYGARRQSSANWSGAYITPKQGRMFTAVHGSWCVPRVAAPVASDAPPADGEYRSSTWIGLDGQRRYL